MGTIISRKRKDGSEGHTALLRIKRDGIIVHQETETFDRKLAAKAWLKKRESELAEMGSLPMRAVADPIFRDVITKYLEEVEAVRPLGKTKRQVLNTVKASSLGDLPGSAISSKELADFARERMTEHGVTPQTVGNYISHISAVFSVAEAAWGYPIRYDEIRKAKAVLKKLGMASKSRERKRRPTLDELNKLMKHFFEMQERRPHSICMPKVISFGIFSTRRQEEITRIKWTDLDRKAQTIIVRDMKHPGQKIGNESSATFPMRHGEFCNQCHGSPITFSLTTPTPSLRLSPRHVPFWKSMTCISTIFVTTASRVSLKWAGTSRKSRASAATAIGIPCGDTHTLKDVATPTKAGSG